METSGRVGGIRSQMDTELSDILNNMSPCYYIESILHNEYDTLWS
jgi:hypothetical protein